MIATFLTLVINRKCALTALISTYLALMYDTQWKGFIVIDGVGFLLQAKMYRKGLITCFEGDLCFGVWLVTRTFQYFDPEYYNLFITTLICIIIGLRCMPQDEDNNLYHVYASALKKFPLDPCYLEHTDFKVDPKELFRLIPRVRNSSEDVY